MTLQELPVRPVALLPRLAGPDDLKRLPEDDLPELAAEIRSFLVEKVCATGGHLGVNLGVVELTIALHRVFDSPHDVILFDTGHQAYVHKILTGRADGFDRLRQSGGLSGYPSRTESAHDWVANSHASTALSYADGIAKALQLNQEMRVDHRAAGMGGGRRVVAVIGDGALTGGLAWEGLNNLAAAPGRPLVVVLNDNGRSYTPTIGGIAHHLRELRHGAGENARTISGSDAGSTVFEQLGLAYLGPVDGHDLTALQAALRHAVDLNRTVVVHVVTEKGRGYGPAEADTADRMHGIGVVDPSTGRPRAPGGTSWTQVFGEHITRIGERRADVVAVTAAMPHPVGLSGFARRFPDRTFDVGIAEQQAVCSAAGLAMAGLHPVVAVYATFLNRAFDQVLMDVALHRLPVTFVLDRAGITGPDGPSHHGMWDPAILAAVPGMALAAPRDPTRLRELLDEAVDLDGPAAIRFPKVTLGDDLPALARIDGVDVLYRSGNLPLDVLIVSGGVMAEPALAAARCLGADGIGVTVTDPRWLQPLNPTLVHLAARHRAVITVEDAGRAAGFGAAFALAAADAGLATPIRVLGLPQQFLGHGGRAELLAAAGLTPDQITATAHEILTTGSPS